MMNISKYSPSEIERAKNRLRSELFLGKLPDPTPTAFIIGGQPASGKTMMIQKLYHQYPNSVVINGDGHRNLHPRSQAIVERYGRDASKHTQKFANELVEYTKELCLTGDYSFIIEGTMRDYHVIEETAKVAHQYGFRVEAHVLAVAQEDSYLGIFQRYEGELIRTAQGRFSPLETHDEAYRQIPLNLDKAHNEKIFDELFIYKRDENGILILGFQHKYDQADYITNEDFSTLFQKFRIPQYMPSFYLSEWIKIEQIALERGETDTDYLNHIIRLKGQFRA
jgi:UDP-N-acetylglucosamine kinase